MYQIQVVRGNLLNVDADVFCFSANSNLLPSIGINKNIFYTAGDELLKECEVIPLIPKGEVYVSSGYNTQAKYLFHCVGPFWHGGYLDEAKDLAKVYISIMKKAISLGVKSIAIPALCCGVSKYPLDEATDIAISTVISCLNSYHSDMTVIFVCNDIDSLYLYRDKLNGNLHDISKYLKRDHITFDVNLTDEEKRMIKPKLFKKEPTLEAMEEVKKMILKRVISKRYPDAVLLLKRSSQEIDESILLKHQKDGPYITPDCIQEFSIKDGKASAVILPFCYKDTLLEKESISLEKKKGAWGDEESVAVKVESDLSLSELENMIEKKQD